MSSKYTNAFISVSPARTVFIRWYGISNRKEREEIQSALYRLRTLSYLYVPGAFKLHGILVPSPMWYSTKTYQVGLKCLLCWAVANIWLSFRKSTHTLYLTTPSVSAFFGTTSKGAFHGLRQGVIILSSSNCLICSFISSLCRKGKRYGLSLMGCIAAAVFTSWKTAYVQVNGSSSKWKISVYCSHVEMIDSHSSIFKCSVLSESLTAVNLSLIPPVSVVFLTDFFDRIAA